MTIWLSLFLLAQATPGPATSPPAADETLTLVEAVALARAHSPLAAAARAQAEGAERAAKAAGRLADPTLELTAENWRGLYIPEGCAHGFQTLEDDSQVLYGISPSHVPDAFRGVRYDDPGLAIAWPLPPVNLSQRDAHLPGFSA